MISSGFRAALLFGTAVLVPASSQEAQAWGSSGHRMVSRLGVESVATEQSLAKEIRDLLRKPETAEDVGELGREPDRLRGAGSVYDADNDPAHFIDLEDTGKVLGGVSLDPLPGARQVFESALRAKNQDFSTTGYLPYAIIEGWQQLRNDFGYWRVALVAEQSVLPPDERAWFANDRRRREMLILRDLGFWSHFVADGSQPLHVSVHFNGWGNYPNPQNYSNSDKLHAYFEGEFVHRYIDANDIAAKVRPYTDCHCPIEQRTVAYLSATRRQVVPLYQLEKAGAFDGVDQKGRDFVAERLAAGVSELRDMIVDAWRSSKDIKVGYPAVSVRDAEDGKVSDFRGLVGLD